MALAAVYTAMHLEEPKNVHPFFSKPSKEQAPEPETHDTITNHDSLNDDPQYALQHTSPQTTKTRQKRTRKATHTKNQPSLESFARRPAPEVTNVDLRAQADDLAGPSLKEDLNLDRRKRRKTTSPEPNKDVADTTQTAQELPSELYHQLHTEAASVGTQEVIDDIMGENTLVANTPKDDTPVSSLPRVTEGVHEDTVPESSLPQPAEGQSRSTTPPTTSQHAAVFSNEGPPPEAADNTTAKVTPKKQIKVTRTGKLVSSPPKPDPSISTTPKKRGRPRKAAKKANLSATITIIRYGSDSASRLAFGQQIDAILSGEKSSKGHTVVVPPKPAGPPKAPHPFFTGKAGQKKVEAQNKPDAESQLATPRKSAITPGKLLAERRKEQTDEPTPAFGILRNNRSVKQSGLHEPSWPSKETAHVRNLDGENASQPSTGPSTAGVSLKPAKLKSNVYTLPAEEEVITRLAQQLSEDMKINPSKTHSDFAPPEDVRLPMRSLTTGIDIQHKVRAQIRAPIETLAQRLYAKTHPAITTLYDDIEHTLTPFDEGICEPQAWAQKYRPGQADHVLQTGNQAFALKDWLQSLTVMAVGAVQDPSKAGTVLDTKRPPKKKRKTAVDNFIVSDDEDEEEEMVELDTNKITPSYQAPSLRRLRWTRNKNVVLISGPHGSGKSATVYAVAKELDFEVFELHSGVRRSGKDIQDKVGDMTANHLVNHKRNDLPIKEKVAPTAVDVDTDNERISTEFQKDLDSGRQGTMTSFFTAKPAAKPKPKPKPKAQVVVKSPAKIKTTPIAQATIPLTHSSRKSQKQSLILIEEADILFEEDQNFWTQIIKLAAQSKRPIVITCNDESQIPTQALPMAAILRLTPPPTDLATDYLVALAGREGHILQRQAISDLYNAKGHDLRASITEMNFWCQMSVGDKKGGLEWMYQRWPPGKDVDAHGRLLRVASEDTYQSGMGWLSHNVFEANPNIAFNKEVELLTEVWNDWGISPMSCNIEAKPTNKSVESDQAAELDKTSQLDQLVTFSDALSASDIFCRVDLPTYEDMYSPPIDATLPSITDKERLSYTIDAPLLQTDHQTDYLALDTSLATQTHLLVHRNFPHLVHRPGDSSSSTSTSLEQYYTHQILRHQTHNRADHNLTRSDCASAFDILASPSDQDHFIDHRTSYNLTPSSFDRTLSIITLDLAPYIRSIVAHEQGLEAQRLRLGNLLSEGGRAKRQRTTRASRTAMEGGERQSKRRERWFSRDLNFELVMRTAGSEWAGLGWKGEGAEEEEVSLTGTQNSEGLGGTQRSGEDGVEMLVDAEK